VSKMRFINPLLQRTEEPAEPDAASSPSADTPVQAALPTTAPAPIAVQPAPPQVTELAPANEAPVKFTFYFQPEQLRRLDDLWLRAKLQYRAKINKSEFVRLALDRLIDEFDNDPQRVLEDMSRHKL